MGHSATAFFRQAASTKVEHTAEGTLKNPVHHDGVHPGDWFHGTPAQFTHFDEPDRLPAQPELPFHATRTKALREPEGSQQPGFTFQHAEIDTGGMKYPRRIDLTAHHPQTGEEAGKLRYFPPKRKGGPVTVDSLDGHHPGAASALMNEMEARHPGSRVVHANDLPLSKEKKTYTHPDYGRATDWEAHHSHLPDQIHRGMSVKLDSHDAKLINGGTGSAAEHADTLRQHLTTTGPLGMHWSSKEEISRNFAHRNIRDPRTEIPVILHADKPDPKHIETRPSVLKNNGVWSHDYEFGDAEVPMRRGKPMAIRGISWKPDAHHPEADENGWLHHTYEEPIQHKASLQTQRGGTVATVHPAPGPEAYARRDDETGYDHEDRIRRGLSLGHMTYEQARTMHGYLGSGHENTRLDPGKGWQPLPQTLYHTTTDAEGVKANGLRSGKEIGQKKGHGLGGTPEYLSLTHSAEHAHTMLHALHEYHDVLSGKTSIADLHEAAQRGEGADKPYHEVWEAMAGKKALEAAKRGMYRIDGMVSDETARDQGFKPADDHVRGTDYQGREGGRGWERGFTPEEALEARHRAYDNFSYGREKAGGSKQILFMSNDQQSFVKKDPSHFAVLKVRPRRGAQGFPMPGEHEWRTATGDAVEVHGQPLRRTSARLGGGSGRPFARTASHPRPELPPEQEEALEHPSFHEYRRRSLELAKNPVPGTVIWRGEAREGDPAQTARSSGVGMHWTVNPDAALIPRPTDHQRRVLWQGRLEHPGEQAIDRTHPSWHGRNGYSMDHEAEVRLHPGARVHLEGAYVWHGENDPDNRPVPRHPERTHPDWKWHPVGEHAEINNSGMIDYSHHGIGGDAPPESTTKTPRSWNGPHARTVLEHEHAAGNHYPGHPGGDLDDVDYDAPEEHWRAHSDAIMNDNMLHAGNWTPADLNDHEAAEWLRWHPDRAGIEQRHGGKTATASAAVQDGHDIPSNLLNPHGYHVKALVGGYRNVEMIPTHEVARYASQETDLDHAKKVGRHLAESGQMEPLILQYHPATSTADLGEGNHRLRAARALGMDHVPVRVIRAAYGLSRPGTATPESHPAIATGSHVPADIKPSDLGIGTATKTAATPVPHNTTPYTHEHDWLPREHFFAPGKQGLDPRLFDGDRLRPEVRHYLLGLLQGFWGPRYGDGWQSWARVYLAGGAASHFFGDNNDLDVLIGVDFDTARRLSAGLDNLDDSAIAALLTDELKINLNDEHRMLPAPGRGESGPWESTFFVLKPGPGDDPADIRRLNPYAAYDLTTDTWAVRPVETGPTFGPEDLPEADWDIVDAIRKLVDAIAELPPGPREREGAALYDYLHTNRSAAFGDEGTGLYDTANVTWKALVAAPNSPLRQLVDWKNAHKGAPATLQEAAA